MFIFTHKKKSRNYEIVPIPVCKLINDFKCNCLSFPVRKTWISHGRVGYAKWVNFELFHLLNVLALGSEK
jgi:hypothetical protein